MLFTEKMKCCLLNTVGLKIPSTGDKTMLILKNSTFGLQILSMRFEQISLDKDFSKSSLVQYRVSTMSTTFGLEFFAISIPRPLAIVQNFFALASFARYVWGMSS